MISQTEAIVVAQRRLYSQSWETGGWNGERLYPVMLELEEIVAHSDLQLHTRWPTQRYNAVGTPRCGTKWLQKIISLLVNYPRGSVRSLVGRLFPSLNAPEEIGHFHEGVIEDYEPDKKVIFIYRDPRDSVVSGYFYIKTGQHKGDMGATTETLGSLDPEDGLERQLIKYMKYRMPVMNYWLKLEHSNVVKVRYEDLLSGLAEQTRRINVEAGIGASEPHVEAVIEAVSFKSMSGRDRGAENQNSHLRKGVSGDWRNHFSERHVAIFRDMGGEDFLCDAGYEI